MPWSANPPTPPRPIPSLCQEHVKDSGTVGRRMPDLCGDAVTAANGALHVADERFSVLAREQNAADTVSQHRPERHHLAGSKDGVSAPCVWLVGPRHCR